VLADAQDVGNVGHGAAARQNVGSQRMAETVRVRSDDLRPLENWVSIRSAMPRAELFLPEPLQKK
jgi:hypothetical protein